MLGKGGATRMSKQGAKRLHRSFFYQLSPMLGHKEISMITKTQIIKAVFAQVYFTRVKTGPSSAKKDRC